jgi:mannose-6-phosphate isomerase-like protein (cupin superfamily)
MIYRFKPETEFEIEERSFIVEMLASQADPSCSIARARVKPGITTALHAVRATVERYIILQGEGEVTVGNRVAERVRPMDIVWIDKDETQKIRNISDTEDLVFLCVCTPGFRMDAYIGMEMDMEKHSG